MRAGISVVTNIIHVTPAPLEVEIILKIIPIKDKIPEILGIFHFYLDFSINNFLLIPACGNGNNIMVTRQSLSIALPINLHYTLDPT